MLTISGATWFARRAGTCRLHAIYMNQPCIYVGKVGETVKDGFARHPRRGRSARSKPALGWHNAASRSFAPFHPQAALAFRVTTTTSKPTCLLGRLQHTR